MTRRGCWKWILLGLGMMAAPAWADTSLTLNYSGTFGPSSTLGGVELGVPTPFTYRATFDPTADLDPTDGAGMFDAVVAFDIAGHGTFLSDPGAGVKVVLSDPSLGTFTFGAGIGNGPITGLTGGLVTFFFTATPPFDADAPEPTSLSVVESSAAVVPWVIPLAGGEGDLVIKDVNGLGDTASLTAVPEPSTLTLAGLGVLVLVVCARRRGRGVA